jgi:hypothetical protein
MLHLNIKSGTKDSEFEKMIKLTINNQEPTVDHPPCGWLWGVARLELSFLV